MTAAPLSSETPTIQIVIDIAKRRIASKGQKVAIFLSIQAAR
jgi:hypothetical protein